MPDPREPLSESRVYTLTLALTHSHVHTHTLTCSLPSGYRRVNHTHARDAGCETQTGHKAQASFEDWGERVPTLLEFPRLVSLSNRQTVAKGKVSSGWVWIPNSLLGSPELPKAQLCPYLKESQEPAGQRSEEPRPTAGGTESLINSNQHDNEGR